MGEIFTVKRDDWAFENIWDTVYVKDDVVGYKQSELVKGLNRYSGKSFARFQPRTRVFYSWRSGRLRIYEYKKLRRGSGIRDMTSERLTGKNAIPDGVMSLLPGDPFVMRSGLTYQEEIEKAYPLLDFIQPVPEITPAISGPDMTAFSRRLFGRHYRKDLARAVAQMAQWTAPRYTTRSVAIAKGLTGLVPTDWIVDWMGAEGTRSAEPHSWYLALRPSEVRNLFKTATESQMRRLLRNSVGQLQSLHDSVRQMRQIRQKSDTYSLADVQFKDMKELHDVLSRDYRKLEYKAEDIEYTGKAAKFAREYDDFTIIAPKSSHDLMDWGSIMHNCIGSYGTQAARGSSLLYAAVDSEGKMVANMELDPRDGSIRQLLGKHNFGVRDGYDVKIKNAIRKVWPKANLDGGWQRGF